MSTALFNELLKRARLRASTSLSPLPEDPRPLVRGAGRLRVLAPALEGFVESFELAALALFERLQLLAPARLERLELLGPAPVELVQRAADVAVHRRRHDVRGGAERAAQDHPAAQVSEGHRIRAVTGVAVDRYFPLVDRRQAEPGLGLHRHGGRGR